MPEMLRTIMSDLLSQEPDIVIAGESARHEESLPKAREEGADVLITQDRAQTDGSCLDLILAEPPIGIFAVSADGRSATGVTLLRRGISVESEGRSTIADAIRRMAADLGTAAGEPNASAP